MKILTSLVLLAGGVLALFYYGNYHNPFENTTTNAISLPETAISPVVTITDNSVTQFSEYVNEEYHFQFKYRLQPTGYSLFTETDQQNNSEGSLFGISMIRTDEYNDSQRALEGGMPYDGPPAISVKVLKATGVTDINAWLIDHQQLTNCEEDTILATVIDNQDASGCMWDGLYKSQTLALLSDSYIYLFTGTIGEDETDTGFSYIGDFEEVIASFRK